MRPSVTAAVLVALAAPAVAAEPAALLAVPSRSPWTLRELELHGAALASYDPDTGVAFVVATASEREALARAGFAFATVAPDVEAGLRRLPRDLGAYHSYAETVAEVESLAAAHPTRCVRSSLGRSLEGRDIPVLKISDDPASDDPTEPDVLIVGCHHAREFMSVEVPLHLARTLLAGHGSDPWITRLVDEREIWIVPLLNPDGHVYQEQFAASPAWQPPGWRKNRRANLDGSIGVDLNRNYSFEWAHDEEGSSGEGTNETYRGTSPFSEPETLALQRLVERQRFAIALSYHSFGRLLLYPWGYTPNTLAPDQPAFAALADSMVRFNAYRPGNAYFGTIYITNGEFCDYLYGEISLRKPVSTYAFTVELNGADGGFWPEEMHIESTCASMRYTNLFAIDVADNVRAPLAPPAPALTAVQDPADRARIDLAWTQAVDADNPVHHWEVFEIAPARAVAAWPASLGEAGRALVAAAIPRPPGDRIAVRIEARLQPPWDYAYVEARGADGTWRVLGGDATRSDSPTGRNQGHGLTGAIPDRVLWFDTSAIPGSSFDVAVRLDPVASGPLVARVRARLAVGATWAEERRVLDPDVRDPRYTVEAQRSGLIGYGVTAVDVHGHKADSDVLFFLVPTTEVVIADAGAEANGTAVEVRWRGGAPGDRFEAWAWERHPPPAAEPPAVRCAALRQAGREGGRLRFELAPGAWWVELRGEDPSGARRFGPWPVTTTSRFTLESIPSPARGGATLRFALEQSGPVRLDLWSVDGRLVRTLVAGPVTAGSHTVTWNGRDARERAVASGVYIARLTQASRARNRRFVVLH